MTADITQLNRRLPELRRRFPTIDTRRLSQLLFAVLALLIVATFADYGVSWDENVQNTYGQDLLSYYLTGFRDRSAFHYSNLRYYGGAFDLIAAALNTMTKVKRELGTSGKLSREREIALTGLLQKANDADRAFLTEVKKLKADPNPATKATLCSLFNTASAALTDLNNSGIMPVEDADAKSKLTTIFSTITAATAVITGVGLC